MLFEYETRPGHFFIPVLIVIVGGIFTKLDGWAYVGWMIWIIAAASTFFLVYKPIKDAELRKLERVQEHYAEIIKLDAANVTTKVVVDKTALEGNSFSQSYIDLKIPPAKMKLFAMQVLDGSKKLTIREWTPIKDGKLFSDPEWRRLIAFMRNPVPGQPKIQFVIPINPADERQGYTLTPEGRKWLESVIEKQSLIPALS